MVPHWRYVIEGILGPIRRVVTATATAIPQRVDEEGKRYAVDVDDTSVTLAELANGAVGTIVCSWATRVRRDDLVTLQIDGTGGSALAGLHRCWMQSAADTPTIRRFNPDIDIGADYRGQWKEVAGAADLHQSLPRRLGEFPAPCRRRRTAGLQFCRRYPRCAVGGSVLSQRRRTKMDHPR